MYEEKTTLWKLSLKRNWILRLGKPTAMLSEFSKAKERTVGILGPVLLTKQVPNMIVFVIQIFIILRCGTSRIRRIIFWNILWKPTPSTVSCEKLRAEGHASSDMINELINDSKHDAIRFPGGNSAKNLKGIQNESTYVSNATLEKVKKKSQFCGFTVNKTRPLLPHQT